MTLDWTNLPPQIFEKIFSHFEVRQLKVLSLVCQSWYEEIGDHSKNFVLKCCIFGRENDFEKLAWSRRQYRSLSLCGSHLKYGKDLITTINSRVLRRKSKVENISIITINRYKRVCFADVVDLLNEHGNNLKSIHLDGVQDTDRELTDSTIKLMPNIVSLKLEGSLDLSEHSWRIFNASCERLKEIDLKLDFNENRSLQKFDVINNFVGSKRFLEYLSLKAGWDIVHRTELFDTLRNIRSLKECLLAIIPGRYAKFYQAMSIGFLENNANLAILHLNQCCIASEEVSKIPQYFKNLKEIKLHLDSSISEKSLRGIGEIQSLEVIELSFRREFPAWLDNVFLYCHRNIKSLTLNIDTCFPATDPKGSLSLDKVLNNLINLENLSITSTVLRLSKQEPLCFPNLKMLMFKGCACEGSAYDFFKKLRSLSLESLKADIAGMTDETVEVLLNNFENLRNLNLVSRNKFGLQAVQSISNSRVKILSCNNFSPNEALELFKNSKELKSSSIALNDAEINSNMIEDFLKELSGMFNPPLKISNLASNKYNLKGNGYNIFIGFNSILIKL